MPGPARGSVRVPIEERFWSKVDRSGGPDACWPWTGTRHPKGYGWFYVSRDHGTDLTNRVAFFLTHGRWPTNALHTCDSPPCCNPVHLFEGSNKTNSEDMVAKGRQSRGVDRYNAKLTDADVASIRSRRATGERPSTLAREYRVSPATISDIVAGRTWKVT